MRLGNITHGRNFIHQSLINGQSSRRIHDHDIVAIPFGLIHPCFGNGDRIFGFKIRIDRHPDLLCQHLQLVDRSRAIDVTGHQQGLPAFLFFKIIGQLARKSRFTRTIESGDQNDGRVFRKIQLGHLPSHELGQLIAHDLGQQLSRRNAGQYILAQCLLPYLIGKCFGRLIIDIGIQQRLADLLHGFGHVDLRNIPLTFQYLEGPV